MAKHSHIEWTDTTWNPVTGCTEVSPGCDHCYAKTFAERWRGVPGHPFERGFDLTLRPARLDQPLSWRKPRRVFVNSMSDLFHDAVPDTFIIRVFAVMLAAGRHTFQLLTKRHGRMRALLSRPTFEDAVFEVAVTEYGLDPAGDHHRWWPLPNLWLGVSVEDQKRADLRMPALLSTPAAVRFLSCEPLLGPVDLKRAVVPMGDQRGHGLTASWVHGRGCCRRFHGIDWVIVGGESGPGARPMDLAWARHLAAQCRAAEVAVFVKQLGAAWARTNAADPKGGNWHRWPADLRIREYPRPAADRAAGLEGAAA
jgi:protein gp37